MPHRVIFREENTGAAISGIPGTEEYSMRTLRFSGGMIFLMLLFSLSRMVIAEPAGTGLLFSLTGDGTGDGFTADYALGDPEPEYLADYTLIPDGAKGRAFRGPDTESKLMAYLAPGNIYAERGTISFFWRSRYPVGKMPFKIFYVSYCDHSTLDMTWLRIDYNGSGFDAFVTDVNKARVRVSYTPPVFPAPDAWTHFAFAWDETGGVWLYINGILAAKKDTTTVFSAGLGLFTPHGRFSNPGTVTSNCGHLRGGDIDEIAIYDRMLSPEQIRGLAAGDSAGEMDAFSRPLDARKFRDEWWLRYGWDHPDNLPPILDETSYTVRKVEIHDAYDQKKWSWRANDGIAETTWPDSYNRSSLPGRNDYFIEPDWYCYSTSGKSITFTLPDEPWNYCEVTGAAYGTATRVFLDTERQTERGEPLFSRPMGRGRTFNLSERTFTGGKIRYENTVRETPLAEFQVYHVAPGLEPAGTHTMTYSLTARTGWRNDTLRELLDYIGKRYPADERQLMFALPAGAGRSPAKPAAGNPLPLIHVLVPAGFREDGPRTQENAYGGFAYELANLPWALDGIAIDLPALAVKPTHGEYFPLNIQVKDPVWPNRNLLDFSFRVKPGEPKTLWLDTRDRVIPNGRSLYLTIAGAGADFTPAALEGATLRLVFTERAKGIPEQEIDRFTQVRDNLAANLSETKPQKMKLEWYARFYRDMEDLFAVSPDHTPGRYYWNWYDPESGALPFEQPKAPAGVPLWAFRQTEIVKQWKHFLNWWIDERQIENGELGGGLSDDGDFANCMPGLALLGVDTEKITGSLHRLLDAYYANGMFTNGLSTICTDALHVSEEGTNVQTELMLLEYGDPKLVERIMETAARYPDITAVNAAGHRHFTTRFYSSTFQATEEPWCWSTRMNYSILHPGMALVEFNGSPAVRTLIREVGDGYLSHAEKTAAGQTVIPMEINWRTDEGRLPSPGTVAPLLRVLARWNGGGKYGKSVAASPAQETAPLVDARRLEDAYAATIRYNAQRMYIGTEGFPWDDGPYISYGSILDDRLGGTPINRGDQFPRHTVSWAFEKPHGAENTAILVPRATPSAITVIAYNLLRDPQTAVMTGWDVMPGIWEITGGIDTDGDYLPDADIVKRTEEFERSAGVTVTFPARKMFVIRMELKEEGTPYWSRPDAGIGKDDIQVGGKTISVTVHGLGSVGSSATEVALVDAGGKVLSRAAVPALNAPVDLVPKTVRVTLSIPKKTALSGCRVVLDPERKIGEITRLNNVVPVTER